MYFQRIFAYHIPRGLKSVGIDEKSTVGITETPSAIFPLWITFNLA